MTDEKKHHPSCRPDDNEIIFRCLQCGLETSAEHLWERGTLRDEFAKVSVHAFMSTEIYVFKSEAEMCTQAYRVADAMMEARKRELYT